MTEQSPKRNVRIDTENDQIVLGDTALELYDRHGNEMVVDHTSAMDGYVAFRGANDEATVIFREVGPRPVYSEGTKIVDCGDEGVIEEVRDVEDTVVYDIRFDDGDEASLPASEIEIGIVDGTIKVKP